MADETVTEPVNTAAPEEQATTPAPEASAATPAPTPSPASMPKPHAPSPAAFAKKTPATKPRAAAPAAATAAYSEADVKAAEAFGRVDDNGTVFVKDGDEFVRISTNVLTPEGKRGVGTQLARNAAYEAVSKGSEFCGPIDVLGTAFDACYRPIKDGGGKIVGVSYIGHKK